jgi:hypothetical protein
VSFPMAQRSRAVSPVMERTSPHPLIGKPRLRRPAVSSSFVTIRMPPQANGTIGLLTTLMLTKQSLPKAPAMTAALFKQAINDASATAVPARPAVMDVIVITFVCWPFPSTTCRSGPNPPAARSSENHVDMLSLKRPSSESISDRLWRSASRVIPVERGGEHLHWFALDQSGALLAQ